MKQQLRITIATAALAAIPVLLVAQPTAHYVPGVEGIKGATLPPPGLYLRDYNTVYFADRVNDANGNKIAAADPKAFIYANVPRVVWITDKQVLGGFLGVDALLPLPYTSLEANTPGGRFDKSTFGVGDLFAEATLSWHGLELEDTTLDASLGYGVWAPTGDSSLTNPTKPGLGYWTHMITAGMTWYPESEKKWAVSVLNRYEFNLEKQDTSMTPGQAYTLEWGVSYGLMQGTDVGLVGYCQFQTTKDSGTGAADHRDRVVAVGPELATVCPYTGLMVSLRYLREVTAIDRMQGNTVTLTLTKRF
jgi:hypothetical protein